VIIRHGPVSRFTGPAFRAADRGDLERLARATGTSVRDRHGDGGGWAVDLRDPSGIRVRVVAGVTDLPELTCATCSARSTWTMPSRARPAAPYVSWFARFRPVSRARVWGCPGGPGWSAGPG
jgi:hypothetical protein